MSCETCGSDGSGYADDKNESPLPSVSVASANQVAQDAATIAKDGDLSDAQIENQGQSAVIDFAKKFQPVGPIQVAKVYAEPKKDGSVDVNTAFGTIGSLPAPPTLGPTPRADAPPEPNLLPDYVIPGTTDSDTA